MVRPGSNSIWCLSLSSHSLFVKMPTLRMYWNLSVCAMVCANITHGSLNNTRVSYCLVFYRCLILSVCLNAYVNSMDKDSPDVHQELNKLKTKIQEAREQISAMPGIDMSPALQDNKLRTLREQVRTKNQLLQKYKSLCMFDIPKPSWRFVCVRKKEWRDWHFSPTSVLSWWFYWPTCRSRPGSVMQCLFVIFVILHLLIFVFFHVG